MMAHPPRRPGGLQVRDQAGHEETFATVQLDFNQPERFDVTTPPPTPAGSDRS